jgi:hypothetical protein
MNWNRSEGSICKAFDNEEEEEEEESCITTDGRYLLV